MNALHAGTAYVVFCSVFSLIAFAGLMIARRADALGSFPLSAAMLLFPLTYYITQSAVRYRHPIEPVMTIPGLRRHLRLCKVSQKRGHSGRSEESL